MKKKLLPCLTGVLLALAVVLVGLAAPLHIAGTNAEMMEWMFLRHAPSVRTGLPEAEYRPVAQMVTSFLLGETTEFQHIFTAGNGLTYSCFNAREQAHMADCAVLFALCRTVLTMSLAVLVCMLMAAYLQRKRLQMVLVAFLSTMLAFALCAAGIAAWALIDFEGIFILFHHISFANDLWLLNPATDLLIRLMPTSFFMEYAAFAGGAWLLICALCAAAAVMIRRRIPSEANRGS